MFKDKSVADDIISSMEKNLISNATEEMHGFNKIAKAVDYLNSAADLFDDVGLSAEAEAITHLLESLAAKKDSKKSKDSKDSKKKEEEKKDSKKDSKKSKDSKKTTKKASDPYTDGLTSEQMLKNLETTGTVFDYAADDGAPAEECMDCMDADDSVEVVDSPEFEDE